MTIRFRVYGLSALELEMARKMYRYKRGYKRGVEKACKYILAQSKKIVPVDTGFLKNSGNVKLTGEGFRTIGWVGYDAYYAVWVHEDLFNQHKKGKKAKYLSSVIDRHETKGTLRKIIMDELKK